MRNIKNNINFNEQSILVVDDSELLTLTIATRVEELALKEKILRLSLFSNLKIHIPKSKNKWKLCDFRTHHYLDVSMLKVLPDTQGIDIQICEILEIAERSKQCLQTISTNRPSNWPYLFCAQLQILCEVIGISPKEILYLFGIIFSGDKEDLWKNFQWKYQLQAESIVVSLHSKNHIYSN